MGILKAICISMEKGTEKYRVPEVTLITDYGIEGDAHAGKWHRQISILAYEKIQAFNERGAAVGAKWSADVGSKCICPSLKLSFSS